MIEDQINEQVAQFTPGEKAIIVGSFVVGFALIALFLYWLLESPAPVISTGDNDIIYRENTSNNNDDV